MSAIKSVCSTSRAVGALPALEAAPRARPQRAAALQQPLAAQARTRFTGSSKMYVAGGNRLQAAVEAAAAGRRHVQSRCGPALAGKRWGAELGACCCVQALLLLLLLHVCCLAQLLLCRHAGVPVGAAHHVPLHACPANRCCDPPPCRSSPLSLPLPIAGCPPACAASSACSSTRGRLMWRFTRACSCCSTVARTLVR